jgi:AcrR family transcriptional regulator
MPEHPPEHAALEEQVRDPRIDHALGADERRARRREQLLEAGLEVLGTEGWSATTMTAAR